MTFKEIAEFRLKSEMEFNLNDVLLLLRECLNGVENKRQLTDGEILTIKYIRQEIKGL